MFSFNGKQIEILAKNLAISSMGSDKQRNCNSICLNMFAANPTFDRAGSQLKFRGGGGI